MNEDIKNKINTLFDSGIVRIYSRGTTIIQAEQSPKGIFLLTKGVIEQYDITTDGNKITVNLFKPGAYFPMSWAVNNTPNNYYYSAYTNVELKQLNATKVVDYIKKNPDVMYDLLSRVYVGTDALLRRLVLTTGGVASSRLIFELLVESYRFGESVDKSKKIIKIKQTQLAERSGLARETVSREIRKLEASNLIKVTGGSIELSIDKLEDKIGIGF